MIAVAGVSQKQRCSIHKTSHFRGQSRKSCTSRLVVQASRASNPFEEELKANAAYIATRGKGILASDESNVTTGKRLASVGVENTEENRRSWRELLYTAPGLGQYISGAILFDETLYQSTADGEQFVDVLKKQGIIPGIKVDTGLQVLPGTDGETATQVCYLTWTGHVLRLNGYILRELFRMHTEALLNGQQKIICRVVRMYINTKFCITSTVGT